MTLRGWSITAGLLAATVLVAPAARADTSPHPAVPGVVNYVEGDASIGNQALDAASIGLVQLQQGESLDTEQGRAEVLLTPGALLRLDDRSSVTMRSPSLSKTEVVLDRGRALVEVNELHSENDLRVVLDGVTTHLVRTGLYDFDADQGVVRVVDGRAIVRDGGGNVTVKGGWQLDLNQDRAPIPVRFDRNAFEATDLYKWSNLRSKYLAEANMDAAGRYYVGGWYGPDWYGPGWHGSGWYWDPWLSAYTYVPGDGIFYSTFGWSYYSPRSAHRLHAYRHLGDRDLTGRNAPRAYVLPQEHERQRAVEQRRGERHEEGGRHEAGGRRR